MSLSLGAEANSRHSCPALTCPTLSLPSSPGRAVPWASGSVLLPCCIAGTSYVCSAPSLENSLCLPPGLSQNFMNVPQIPHFTAVRAPSAAAAFPPRCASQQSRRAAPAQATSDFGSLKHVPLTSPPHWHGSSPLDAPSGSVMTSSCPLCLAPAPLFCHEKVGSSGLHRLHPTWRGDLSLSDLILT